MATTSREIIAYLEKQYQQQKDQLTISNCQDVDFGFKVKQLNQYIFGVTPSDNFSPGIGGYENAMKQKLAPIPAMVKCLPWPFHGDEIAEMKTVIHELSQHFDVKLDVDNMINKLKVSRDGEGIYYIVVTVVQYVVAFVE